jgi:uncharacterized protein YecE (DUF72 family)
MGRSMLTANHIHIGTSGWSYEHWKGTFYPMDLPNNQMLAYYSRHFSSVEINNSFYQLPKKQALARWRETVPEDFLFTAKASRYITHLKKLKNPAEAIHTYLDRICMLEDRLGPILFQLPPRWHFNGERLEAFLGILSKDFRYAFEFRDRSWLNCQTFELLSHYNAACCIYDLDGYLSPMEVTANFAYVRLHGPDGSYQGSYDDKTLEDWAENFSAWSEQGKEVFCFFDNDQCGYAVHNAHYLQSLLNRPADP